MYPVRHYSKTPAALLTSLTHTIKIQSLLTNLQAWTRHYVNSFMLQATLYGRLCYIDRKCCTSPGHCGAVGRSILQCSRSVVFGGQGSSQWWGADKLVWLETSSPRPLCSRSWALLEVQTAAGLQEHPHHTHRAHTQTSPQPGQKYPEWRGTCTWGRGIGIHPTEGIAE